MWKKGDNVMHRKKELTLVLLPGFACIALLILLTSGPAGAAYPAQSTTSQYSDPYRHLSGVVAVPPSLMMGKDNTQGAPATRRWAGPLTPPVFGPNVDATLNNGSNQNETTV